MIIAEQSYDDGVYWIWLQSVLGYGSHRVNALASRFDSPRLIREMDERELARSRCFTPAEIGRIKRVRLEEAAAVYSRCNETGVRIITPQDSEYPERLRNIYAMPCVLYVRGDLSGLDGELVVTMVGTRKCSDYGLRCAGTLAQQLAEYGATVLSGCAQGIDTACLHGAIRRKGRVIGVLGSGLDVPYPASNEKMLRWMAECQRLISEYPPGSRPLRAHFPVRNRILSALGVGVVVVEAPRGSGALITANYALEQGKDIFAVPGRIDEPCAAGGLDLIRQGALPVCGAEDILSEYERLFPEQLARIDHLRKLQREAQERSPLKREAPPDGPTGGFHPEPEGLDDEQKLVYRALTRLPAPAQELSARTGLPISRLLPVLTELEICGYAEPTHGGRYVLTETRPAGEAAEKDKE